MTARHIRDTLTLVLLLAFVSVVALAALGPPPKELAIGEAREGLGVNRWTGPRYGCRDGLLVVYYTGPGDRVTVVCRELTALGEVPRQ